MSEDETQLDSVLSDAPHGPPARRIEPPAFEQLTLDATIVAPGRRTEDPYEPGTKLKVKGQRGVFMYKYASVSQAGLVSLHVAQEGVSRAVRPDQVTLVRKSLPRK